MDCSLRKTDIEVIWSFARFGKPDPDKTFFGWIANGISVVVPTSYFKKIDVNIEVESVSRSQNLLFYHLL